MVTSKDTLTGVEIRLIFFQITSGFAIKLTMGTNRPLIADLFLNYVESYCMAKPHKDPSKSDLIHKFDNTYYLDSFFAVNSRDLSKYDTTILSELTSNKANEDSSCPCFRFIS